MVNVQPLLKGKDPPPTALISLYLHNAWLVAVLWPDAATC